MSSSFFQLVLLGMVYLRNSRVINLNHQYMKTDLVHISPWQQHSTSALMLLQGKDCQLEGKKFQFLITSYNFVPKLKDQLQTLAPQVMVLDEAHSIKASKASLLCQSLPWSFTWCTTLASICA